MRKTLYVHIGVHKTGSTAIQTYLSWHLPMLRWLGADVDYPRLGGRLWTRNQDIADDIVPADKPFSTQSAYLDRVARSRSGSVLISAERFCRQPRSIEYFAPFMRLCRVRIVVFVRRQDRFLESMYRQMVKNTPGSNRGTFAVYAQRRMESRISHESLDWSVRLEPWRSVFGAENIIVVPYAEERAFDSIAEMGRILSVPTAMRMPFILRRNTSLCCESVEMVRRLEAEGSAVDRRRIRRFDRGIRDPSTCYLDPDERLRIVSGYEGSNRRVGELYRCDMSPLLPSHLSPRPPGRIFAADAFDHRALVLHAKRTGLLRDDRTGPHRERPQPQSGD